MRPTAILICALLCAVASAAPAAAAQAPDLNLLAAAYAPGAADGADGRLAYLPGQGLVRSRSTAAFDFAGDQIHDLSLTTAAVETNPALVLMRPEAAAPGRAAVELAYKRNWPGAVAVQKGRVSLDLTPHAGFGVSTSGAQLAEAGAVVRLGAQLQRRMLLVTGADAALRGSRLFLYAGATGRAVGLNLLKIGALSDRPDSAGDGFVREAQAGLGFRRGALSASVGYTYERVRYRTLGDDPKANSRVGLTLSLTPR